MRAPVMGPFTGTIRGLVSASVFIFVLLQATACKKEYKPVTEAGFISVSVLELSSDPTGETVFNDVGGTLKLTYKGPEKYETDRSFLGVVDVPVAVLAKKKKRFELSRLQILTQNEQGIADFTGETLEAIKKEGPNGVRVRVLIRKDSEQKPEVIVTYPGKEYEPNLQYKPLTDVFEDPSRILSTSDVEGALRLLREIASATSEWHESLLALAAGAASLDSAHLRLLMDACYYPYAERTRLYERYTELVEGGASNSPESNEELSRLSRAIQLADTFGTFVNRIAAAGFPKLLDLTFETAVPLLSELYPSGDAYGAFRATADKLSLKGPEKLKLLDLALAKGQVDFASEIAADWFKTDSDKKAATLLRLAPRLSGDPRDAMLVSAAAVLAAPTLEEAKALVEIAAVRKDEVGLAVLRRMNGLDGTQATAVALLIPAGSARDNLLVGVVDLIPRFTVQGAKDLVALAYAKTAEVALALAPKIDSLTAVDLAAIANISSSGAVRDRILEESVRYLSQVDLAGAKAIVQAAYAKVVQIAVSVIPRVSGLNGQILAEIASVSSSGPVRDSILISGSSSLTSVTSAGLKAMLLAAFAQRVDLVRTVFPKVSDLNGMNLADIANVSTSGNERDEILEIGAGHLKTIGVEGIKAVVSAAYARRAEIALTLLPKLERFDGFILADIANISSSGAVRDRILEGGIERLKKPSADEAKAILNSSFGRKQELAFALLLKIEKLTAQTVAELAGVIQSGTAKDAVILEGLRLLTAITAAEHIVLIQAKSSAEREIAMAGIEKTQDLTVFNAVRVADVIGTSNRDAYLLRAVEITTDLSAGNLLQLADKAVNPAQREEIIRKGLDRLNVNP